MEKREPKTKPKNLELIIKRSKLPCSHANQGLCNGCPVKPETKKLIKEYAS